MEPTSRHGAASWQMAAVGAQGSPSLPDTEQIENASTFHGLSGRSPSMRQLISRMQRMAPNLTVALIEGADGTGKTLAARALHAAGHAVEGPFIACRAALFFTGIESDSRSGWSEEILSQAAAGMLFLDGVHQLSDPQQELLAEFLNWLDDRSFDRSRQEASEERRGERSGRDTNVPAQIVFSSSIGLQPTSSSNMGSKYTNSPSLLRDDVASRLCAVRFHIPPLIERREDIPLLAQIFIQRFARKYGKSVRGLGPGTIAPLLRYEWPGNVRELENIITAAALETESQWIRPIDLPPLTAAKRPCSENCPTTDPAAPSHDPVNADAETNLDQAIRNHVLRVLQRTRGNKLRAAQLLGISRSTLYRILGANQSPASQL